MIYNKYEEEVEKLILTSGKDRLIENTLGLVGEAGEFAEKIKKCIRDTSDYNDQKEELLKELGDVLFYLTSLCNYFDSDLSIVMEMNIRNLHDRKKRNKLQGSGDNR